MTQNSWLRFDLDEKRIRKKNYGDSDSLHMKLMWIHRIVFVMSTRRCRLFNSFSFKQFGVSLWVPIHWARWLCAFNDGRKVSNKSHTFARVTKVHKELTVIKFRIHLNVFIHSSCEFDCCDAKNQMSSDRKKQTLKWNGMRWMLKIKIMLS